MNVARYTGDTPCPRRVGHGAPGVVWALSDSRRTAGLRPAPAPTSPGAPRFLRRPPCVQGQDLSPGLQRAGLHRSHGVGGLLVGHVPRAIVVLVHGEDPAVSRARPVQHRDMLAVPRHPGPSVRPHARRHRVAQGADQSHFRLRRHVVPGLAERARSVRRAAHSTLRPGARARPPARTRRIHLAHPGPTRAPGASRVSAAGRGRRRGAGAGR